MNQGWQRTCDCLGGRGGGCWRVCCVCSVGGHVCWVRVLSVCDRVNAAQAASTKAPPFVTGVFSPHLWDGDALEGVHQQHAGDEVARAWWRGRIGHANAIRPESNRLAQALGAVACTGHPQHQSIDNRPRSQPTRAQVRWQVVYPALDLFEQVGDVLVVKRQAAAEQRVQDDAAGPDVHLWAGVELAADDLGALRLAAVGGFGWWWRLVVAVVEGWFSTSC